LPKTNFLSDFAKKDWFQPKMSQTGNKNRSGSQIGKKIEIVLNFLFIKDKFITWVIVHISKDK
jgi:hypothetical protein